MRIGVNRYILRSERDDEISREEHQNIYLQTFSICLRAKRKHKHMYFAGMMMMSKFMKEVSNPQEMNLIC